MLSAHEFTVGDFSSAKPLSLVLPRNDYDTTALVGHINGSPQAVLLSGDSTFVAFPSSENDEWSGLIIPNVSIEVDETSVFDPNGTVAPIGSLVRLDTRLAVKAKNTSSSSGVLVTLHDKLVSAKNLRAGFRTWQIVVGTGADKRVLWHSSPNAAKPKSE